MWSPKLGEMCEIKASEIRGLIIGEWTSLDGMKQWQVRYADRQGAVRTDWFYTSELGA